MCPPPSIHLSAKIDEYWTDERIIMSLFNFKNGKRLPSNVTSDVNPFHHSPSALPADLWYYCSGVKEDAECGFWVATGEACEIYSNSTLLGSRTTLQFYEGRAPHERKTDWAMLQYTINEKRNNNVKDHRALCRVFLADEKKRPPRNYIANIDVEISIDLVSTTVSNNETRRSRDWFLENSSEMDCILSGDYLELNDLVDRGSLSSSSTNSSCLTMTSDECFDSMAMLRELEDGVITDQEMKDSSVKFNLSAPIKSKEIVVRPATSVSLRNDKRTAKGVGRTKRRKMIKYLHLLAF